MQVPEDNLVHRRIFLESHCILLALCSGIIRLIHSKSKVALLKLEVLFLEMHATLGHFIKNQDMGLLSH